ncbi:MAG: phosphatidate cytidylyltransferase [Bacilli bacterium]|nr:phosphatidate cytidylyltransferase [Bacilli bacterium]
MKKRVISSIVALLICVPLLIIGGFIFDVGVIIIGLLGIREFLHARQTKKELPMFINFISYIVFTLLVASGIRTNSLILDVDFRVISALVMVFLIPVVLYHDRKLYSVTDAFYLIGGIFFLGISFSLFIIYRNINILLLAYLFIITIITDTYAYIMGRLIGRRKLLEEISPNKTWEGMLSGTLLGTLLASVFYITVLNSQANIALIIFVTLFLSIIGQFGDLVFSAIKRYFGIKDFSNIMPGHGGILDRLDSIIFVMLGFIFFISIV